MVKEGGRFVAQSAAADLVAQRLRPRGSSRDRQPAGLVDSVRGSLSLEGWMRPKQTIEGTPEESRPDGERRAEVTKNLREMVVGQQRRGDRGASVRTPAGMGSYDMNDWKLSSSRLQMLARSKEQGAGTKAGDEDADGPWDHASKSTMSKQSDRNENVGETGGGVDPLRCGTCTVVRGAV